MSRVQGVGVSPTEFAGGSPSGNVMFVAIPEPSFIALSDLAAKRGMTVAQAFSEALHAYCEKAKGV